jgi:hypothetical protein
VALVRTDDSEERIASIIRVERIGELGTALAVTSNAVPSSQFHPEDGGDRFLRNVGSHKGHTALYPREYFKSYRALTVWALKRIRNVFLVRYELGFYSPEDGILYIHRRENLKSYIALTGWAL